MPRPLRVNYPHANYHVMNRGAAHNDIFKFDKHRTIFLSLLAECHEKFNINIHAYCLMSNHYHLLISTPEANLPDAMRHLNGTYTQMFNRIMESDGALFRGRYKALLIDDDSYMLAISRYIHLNPVEGGIVNNPAEYYWSSYRAYLNLAEVPNWLDVASTLNHCSPNGLTAGMNIYKAYVERPDPVRLPKNQARGLY